MIKNLITAALVATAPMTQHRAVITQDITKTQTVINIPSNEFAEYTYENEVLTAATLYNVKEQTKPINIGTATFEYKQIDKIRWTADGTQKTYSYQYYKVTRNTTTQVSLNIDAIGSLNNTTLQPYASDVTVYKPSSYLGNIHIPTFFASETYTLNELKVCTDPNSLTSLDASVEVDTTNLANGYTLMTKQTNETYYIVGMDIDYDVEEQINIDNIRYTTYNYLTNVTIHYNYSVTIENTDYEVIDIPGLMFEILGMPFAWLSTAFNLTIFPGTPYAINISHLMFAVIGTLILIVILKKILK